jgi:hypothetical protein
MALNKAQFIANLKAALDFDPTNVNAKDAAAEAIADNVDAYIRSMTISVSTTVTGTCATPSGPGTIVGSGSGTATIS